MKEMSNFQLGLLIVFIVSLVGGVILFATRRSNSQETAFITVWGSISSETFNKVYQSSNVSSNKKIVVSYVRKDPANFDQEFIEALADGVGPDIVIMRQDSFFTHRNKIYPIPYNVFSERNFKNLFIENGEIFLTPDGILAFPFMVDPMVLYWNRDMFTTNLVVNPPRYWDEFYSLINRITRKDSSGNVMQSAVALGEWNNVSHAKSILSLLLIQAGTPIVSYSSSFNSYRSTLAEQFNYTIPPSQSALTFYTQFSNPTNTNYTWNRSLPSSLNFFLSSNLATYIGFSSELFTIQQRNPNLNFDVTYVPQVRGADKTVNFANIYGLALVRQSKNIPSAFSVVSSLVEPGALKALESDTSLPPVRRDLLADKPTDAYRSVFYDSALVSSSWMDPSPTESTNIFRTMVESVTSGQARISESVTRASSALDTLFR